MAQTARYCLDCLLALMPSSASTPEDRFVLSAIGFEEGGSPNYEPHHKIDVGKCQKCNKDAVLVYYELPD
jgi:hypothetical protein